MIERMLAAAHALWPWLALLAMLVLLWSWYGAIPEEPEPQSHAALRGLVGLLLIFGLCGSLVAIGVVYS